MPIGKRIKQRREELGWSQDYLAKRMGYKTRSTITKIEAEINDVTQSNIMKFAEVLDTTPAWLMDWDTDDTRNSKLGNQLKQLRLSKNLSLNELAEEIHIGSEELEQYESGSVAIPKHIIDLYRSYFGAEVLMVENKQTALLTKNEKLKQHYDKWSQAFSYDGQFTDEQIDYLIQFAKLLRNMSDDEAKQAIKYAQFLTNQKGE